MFPNFNDNNFDKQFEQLIKKTFGIAIAAWIISAILGSVLTVAFIYFLVKLVGAL